MKEKESPDFPKTLRELYHKTFLHHFPVVAPTQLPKGLGVMGACDEGRHGLERVTQDPVISMIFGRVLTQILFKEERKCITNL